MTSYGKYLNLISNKIKRKIETSIQIYNLSAIQGRIIAFIYNESKKRDLYQKDIEDEFELRGSSVTSTISNLEKQGLVVRKLDSKDQRLKKILLTEKAVNTYKNIKSKIEAIEEETFSTLTLEEKEYFDKIIEKVIKKIEQY